MRCSEIISKSKRASVNNEWKPFVWRLLCHLLVIDVGVSGMSMSVAGGCRFIPWDQFLRWLFRVRACMSIRVNFFFFYFLCKTLCSVGAYWSFVIPQNGTHSHIHTDTHPKWTMIRKLQAEYNGNEINSFAFVIDFPVQQSSVIALSLFRSVSLALSVSAYNAYECIVCERERARSSLRNPYKHSVLE